MFGNAQAYERFMGRWSRLIAPQFFKFAAIGDMARILDVGTGTGSLAAVIAARNPGCSVVGIDPSAEFVAFATSAKSEERISFEVGDAQDLQYASQSFDAAISLLVFNFIPQPARALAELRRVVRPEGIIAAAVWDYGDAMQMLRIFWEAAIALDSAAEPLDEKRMPLCRAGELRELWSSAGLSEVMEESLETPAPFASFDDFWSPFLLGQGPAGAYVKKLAPIQVEALRSEVERRLPAAPFELRARVWAVRGLNC